MVVTTPGAKEKELPGFPNLTQLTVNSFNFYDETPLMAAIRCPRRPELIAWVLSMGAMLDLANKNGCTALMIAADRSGAEEIILLLLEAKANLDLQDAHGQTALIRAVRQGHYKNVLTLVKAKANLSIRDAVNHTALDWAQKNAHTHPEIVSCLISATDAAANPLTVEKAHSSRPPLLVAPSFILRSSSSGAPEIAFGAATPPVPPRPLSRGPCARG